MPVFPLKLITVARCRCQEGVLPTAAALLNVCLMTNVNGLGLSLFTGFASVARDIQ